ncbi:HD domain-containing protein [Eisenibacter elegans]|jgi:HD superfamily phosphohydrolase|uniref:HD domain-containing protein n=1 Tax=Eisenibacter elegans TaxID=997 RepID=UPI0004169A11|nr:HD domain-containing protein [Eisenibacter elegans]
MILPYNKRKIINDPVYGFINIKSDLIFDLLEHPYFQRLRRIRQLGMADYVYPGALHTRFHHALGAMHLMGVALDTLRHKGYEVSDQEFEAAQIAILLHDIGHGPMSHALEHTILSGVPHEYLSLQLMEALNRHYQGALQLTIDIFTGRYPRPFLHQLVSSQLDIDRMDYLQRDSFFTGVSEGTIGASRIIKMLALHNDALVVEEKGIYSIENFLTARRLMYWQVYLHKTNVSADVMLIQLINRAKQLVQQGQELFAPPSLHTFLAKEVSMDDFKQDTNYLRAFANLDDYDIWACIKLWVDHPDKVLSRISRMLLSRQLFKVRMSREPIKPEQVKELRKQLRKQLQLDKEEAKYFVVKGIAANEAYLSDYNTINILCKDGRVIDIAQASDLPNIKALRKVVKKYYLCWYHLI